MSNPWTDLFDLDDMKVRVRTVPHIICDACGREVCLGAQDWHGATPMDLLTVAKLHWDRCQARNTDA